MLYGTELSIAEGGFTIPSFGVEYPSSYNIKYTAFLIDRKLNSTDAVGRKTSITKLINIPTDGTLSYVYLCVHGTTRGTLTGAGTVTGSTYGFDVAISGVDTTAWVSNGVIYGSGVYIGGTVAQISQTAGTSTYIIREPALRTIVKVDIYDTATGSQGLAVTKGQDLIILVRPIFPYPDKTGTGVFTYSIFLSITPWDKGYKSNSMFRTGQILTTFVGNTTGINNPGTNFIGTNSMGEQMGNRIPIGMIDTTGKLLSQSYFDEGYYTIKGSSVWGTDSTSALGNTIKAPYSFKVHSMLLSLYSSRADAGSNTYMAAIYESGAFGTDQVLATRAFKFPNYTGFAGSTRSNNIINVSVPFDGFLMEKNKTYYWGIDHRFTVGTFVKFQHIFYTFNNNSTSGTVVDGLTGLDNWGTDCQAFNFNPPSTLTNFPSQRYAMQLVVDSIVFPNQSVGFG